MTSDNPAGIGVIDIWRWSLDRPDEEITQLRAVLSDDEKERADQFYKPRDTARFIAGRGILRHVLADYVAMPSAKITFSTNEFGKPAIAPAGHPPVHFNLSHSDGEAVLAVSDRFQLGIDIEAVKPLKEDIANRFFSKRECAALEPLRGDDDLYFQAFFRCWTRKEAFVKAHGAGLTLPLDSFDVTVETDRPPQLERLEGDPDASWRWKLAVVETTPGFAGALAVLAEGESFSLRYRSLSEIYTSTA